MQEGLDTGRGTKDVRRDILMLNKEYYEKDNRRTNERTRRNATIWSGVYGQINQRFQKCRRISAHISIEFDSHQSHAGYV